MSTMCTAARRGLGCLDPKEGRALARRDALPELLLSNEQHVLIEGVSGDRQLDPFARPPVIIDSTADLDWITHMLCCNWAMHFSAALFSEKDQGRMNFDSNTAPLVSTTPSRVAAMHFRTGCRARRWTSFTARPVLASNHRRLRSSVTTPSWTMRFPERSSDSTSPRFSCQRRRSAASSRPIMIRASEPPIKLRRSDRLKACDLRRTGEHISHLPYLLDDPFWIISNDPKWVKDVVITIEQIRAGRALLGSSQVSNLRRRQDYPYLR